MSNAPRRAVSAWLAYARLCRLPNVFTAVADIAMGFLVARQCLEPLGAFFCLAASSALLYTAGMVLNDVFDFEIDARERPFRPLPAGQIALPLARAVGLTMLLLGIAFGGMAGWVYSFTWPWRSGLVALAIAGCVLLYDGFLKRTPFGPVGMGLCRFGNVLLGMSAGADLGGDEWFARFPPAAILPAAGIGTYIIGVTWFARGEAGKSQVWQLLGGVLMMTLGVALLAYSHRYLPAPKLSQGMFTLALALLGLTILRRCGAAMLNPSPERVQAAVKQGIISLILFDAAISAQVAPTGYAVAVVALVIPMLLLGKWVYST